MVKSVLGVNHQGLKDWLFQRMSALLMTAYTLFIVGYLLTHHPISYLDWHYLFSLPAMKVATIMCLLSLLYHAWIGAWTVLTDYVKSFALRALLDGLIILMLFVSFFWGILMVWGI